jgi:hypothetical protein
MNGTLLRYFLRYRHHLGKYGRSGAGYHPTYASLAGTYATNSIRREATLQIFCRSCHSILRILPGFEP